MPIYAVPDDGAYTLKGGPDSIEPKAKSKADKTPSETAVNDAIMVVVGAWLLLVLLAYSLRHHIV